MYSTLETFEGRIRGTASDEEGSCVWEISGTVEDNQFVTYYSLTQGDSDTCCEISHYGSIDEDCNTLSGLAWFYCGDIEVSVPLDLTRVE